MATNTNKNLTAILEKKRKLQKAAKIIKSKDAKRIQIKMAHELLAMTIKKDKCNIKMKPTHSFLVKS